MYDKTMDVHMDRRKCTSRLVRLVSLDMDLMMCMCSAPMELGMMLYVRRVSICHRSFHFH